MVVSVLDASSLLRFLLGEAGAQRVKAVFVDAQDGKTEVVISAVNWGEVVGKIYKSQGKAQADALLTTMQFHGLKIIDATASRAAGAASLKVELGLPYADAFCIELAASYPESLLITADFDFLPASNVVRIEFLPVKARP